MKLGRNLQVTEHSENAVTQWMPSFLFVGSRLLFNSTINTHAVRDLNASLRCVWSIITWLFLMAFGCAVHAELAVVAESVGVDQHINYRDRSDAQLTNMVGNWASLSPTQRRLLLSEIRARMKSAKTADSSGGAQKQDGGGSKQQLDLNRVSAQQSYGRTVRRPDGSLVTETETIKITPRGRQVTRHTTIRPANGGPQAEVGNTGVVASSGLPPAQRVVRTKIRFGTGFEQRRSTAADPTAAVTASEAGASAPDSESPQR